MLEEPTIKTIGDRQHPPVVRDDIRVLVVEDIVANQEVACAILEHAGYEADVVIDGKAAIEALEARPYDLVLMDCCMPVMDGFEATRSIRASRSHVLNPEIPIIAVTALAMRGDREKCIEAGMNDYMSKPVDPAKLISMIQRCLDTASRRVLTETDPDLASVISEPATLGAEMNEITNRAGFEWPPGLLDTIIELFLEDTPKQIAELQAALQGGNSGILRAVSHKIRGSSDILGTTSISALAMAVERAAKAGDFERTAELTPKLVEELQELLTKLACVDVWEA